MHTPCETVEIGSAVLFEAYYAGWEEARAGFPCYPPAHWLIPRKHAYVEGWSAKKVELLSDK